MLPISAWLSGRKFGTVPQSLQRFAANALVTPVFPVASYHYEFDRGQTGFGRMLETVR
jgi:hypothetical protein